MRSMSLLHKNTFVRRPGSYHSVQGAMLVSAEHSGPTTLCKPVQ